MHTTLTTKLAAMMIAVLMTVATQGTMLRQFDGVSQDATFAQGCSANKTLVTLDTVTVTSRKG